MAVKSYNPKQVIITIGGVPIGGFADGTFISVERDEDLYTKVTGADGETSRAKSNNQAGTVTLTLSQTSASNDVLSALALADQLNNDGIAPFLMKDLSGRTLVSAGEAWVQTEPPDSYGKELEDREWVVATGPMSKFTGGN